MGALMRSIDWSTTAVGPVESMAQSLRTALSILLETGFPMYIAVGTGYTQFYNDGYRPILGSTKHPTAMGTSTRETFAEIWDIIGPMFQRRHGGPGDERRRFHAAAGSARVHGGVLLHFFCTARFAKKAAVSAACW